MLLYTYNACDDPFRRSWFYRGASLTIAKHYQHNLPCLHTFYNISSLPVFSLFFTFTTPLDGHLEKNATWRSEYKTFVSLVVTVLSEAPCDRCSFVMSWTTRYTTASDRRYPVPSFKLTFWPNIIVSCVVQIIIQQRSTVKMDRLLGAFAKLRKPTICFVMFVCPHGTTRLPLDGFWWNFIFETSSKLLLRKFKFR